VLVSALKRKKLTSAGMESMVLRCFLLPWALAAPQSPAPARRTRMSALVHGTMAVLGHFAACETSVRTEAMRMAMVLSIL
jgi:hypothetical protein